MVPTVGWGVKMTDGGGVGGAHPIALRKSAYVPRSVTV